MKMIHLFSLLILLLIITNIKNDMRRNQEMKIFNFIDFSNLKCNNSDYITSFNAKVCGNNSFISNQNFAFSFLDTINNSHSIKCSILVDRTSRNLEETDNSYDYDSDIETNEEIQTNIYNSDSISNEIINDDSKEIKTDYTSSPLDTSNIIDAISNSPINQKEKEDISKTTNEIDITYIKEETDSTYNKNSSEIGSSEITEKVEDILDSNTETTISDYNKDASIIDIRPTFHYNFCYETICTFKGMIKEDFQFIINENFQVYIDEFPDVENIFLQTIYYDPLHYNISKCFLIKNIFKEVLKYKLNISEKKITFMFISIILGKIERNEEIQVNIFLKKDGNLEKNNAICYSQQEFEPVEGKEILAFYNCEINNIENPNEYSGLIFNSSLDVKNITNDSNLIDPALTDQLIKEGKVQDYSLPIFNSISIDISECEENGQFKILGTIDRNIDEIENLTTLLFLDENKNTTINCSIPQANEGNINMTCMVHNNFNKSKIFIPQYIFEDINNEYLLNITEIKYENEATCEISKVDPDIIIIPPITNIISTIPTSTDIIIEPKIIDSEIIFRQISYLKINSAMNKINFNIIAFSFNNLEKNSYINIPINLIYSNETKEGENASCALNNDANGARNNLYPLVFYCELNNINDIGQVNDIEIIPSPLIKNIPIDNSNLDKASITDYLIKQGILLDYIKEENFNKIPLLFYDSKINAEKCDNDGTFEIISFTYTPIEKNTTFNLKLNNPNITARCKIPISLGNRYITIKCSTMNSFAFTQIKINSKIAYDMDYNELFYINNTESNNYITCQNNDKIKLEEAKIKVKTINIFRQASKFKKKENKYNFFLSTFIKKVIGYNSKILLTALLKEELNNKKTNLKKKRKLSRIEENQNVECTLSTITDMDENGIGAAGWNCTTGESNIKNATGLEIIKCDDISGIPDDPNLIDPAKTDELINNGEMPDYSIEENLNELLPIFNTLAMNYSLCKKNGSFYFTGNISSTIQKDILFNLSLSYPESIFACRLPRTLKGKITQIECFNRDDFENSTVIVEETVIRDGYNEFFILKNTSSGEKLVTCSSSEKETAEIDYNEDFKTIHKTIYEDKSSGGIGTVGLIIIIVVGVLALIAIIIFFIFLKRKNKKKNIENNDRKTVNSSGSSFGSSSSSYY